MFWQGQHQIFELIDTEKHLQDRVNVAGAAQIFEAHIKLLRLHFLQVLDTIDERIDESNGILEVKMC